MISAIRQDQPLGLTRERRKLSSRLKGSQRAESQQLRRKKRYGHSKSMKRTLTEDSQGTRSGPPNTRG